MDWQEKYNAGLPYQEFLEQYAQPQHRQRWRAVYDQVGLDGQQQLILREFTRQMHVLCLTSAWCGDCVNQCPILQKFAEAGDQIALRFLDRDAHPDVQAELRINGGDRVPVVVFLSEDFLECGRYGDRTLAKYRDMARTLLGPACPTGIGPRDPALLRTVTAEWLTEFERVQLMLRLSSRLRQRHGD